MQLIVGAPLAQRRRRSHPQVHLAEAIQQRRERLCQTNGDRMGVDDLRPRIWPQHEGRFLRLRPRVGDAVEIGLHRGGVEGGAIVEFDIAAQGERVGQPIRRDRPRLRQARRELARLRILIDQRIIHARERDPQLRRSVDVRIDARWRQRQSIDQPARRWRDRRTGRRPEGQPQPAQGQEYDLSSTTNCPHEDCSFRWYNRFVTNRARPTQRGRPR